MIYPITQLMTGHSLSETWTLWKLKLSLFNPRTYDRLRFVKWWCVLQYERLAAMINRPNE